MTINQLCSKIAKQEGKKHQASIGDVREIIGLICDELSRASEGDFANLVNALHENGRRRKLRRKNK